MSEPRFLSLRWRLMVPLLAVWLGSMVLAVAVLYLGILDRFQGLVGQHARMMATAVQSAAETAREPEDLHRFVAALGASRDMEKVVLVAGAPPRILASSDHRLSGQLPEHLGDTDLVGQLSRALEERKGWQRVDPAGLRLDLLEPVLLLTAASTGGRLEAGALYLRMDASPLWQAAKEIVVQLSLWLGGILTALASLIYLLLSRFVLTPAEGLRQALLDRKEGLVTVSLTAPRRDELGELALTLDSLLGNLEGRNQEVARMTRLYQALSATNQAIVHCEGPASLLSEVCRIAVEQGQLDLAWIGFVDPETGGLLPVAVHRQGGVSDPAALHCFLGREGVPAAPQVFNDVRTTPLAPACLGCSEHMLDGAFAVFPIRGDEGPDGALVLRTCSRSHGDT
ncbi:HAMP domain-containing protein [Zoogloea sp.]|uniref:HAMP domain-containing protein n=1 Tax=Zoogloea sp. TaxID=49181 RepID=UPI00262E587E|nr:HAMP domain-containing protein [Zoogloea sp.]MDD3352410.1 HAMP domain-containing protein [Zoogloea sp.]